jgi:hypothetical protein
MSDTKIHPVLDEEKSMHERMANLPDIPELPQCTCQTLAISHNPAIPPKKVLCLVCSAFQEMNITREEYTAMRAAYERCPALADKVRLERERREKAEAQRDEARALARRYLYVLESDGRHGYPSELPKGWSK